VDPGRARCFFVVVNEDDRPVRSPALGYDFLKQPFRFSQIRERGVSEAERLEAVTLAVALGNAVNARTTFGDYPMIGTVEVTLLRYPDNIQDLLGLGVGDPRFNQMTALHGAVICNQPSIVQYLIEQGAQVNARNQLGWTPLDVAGGLYIANAHKTSPASAEILRQATAAQELPTGR
jgi:hypothetical protein